ncbi:hypothetical protein D9M69_484240 [compost metagenome]
MVEHHLEQRVTAQWIAAQRLDHSLERQILVGLRALDRTPGGLQHVHERLARIQAPTQHLGIDEEADQPLYLPALAVGVGHAQADVGLPSVAVQQGLEGRQQDHEQRRAPGPRQGVQALAEGLVQAQAESLGG